MSNIEIPDSDSDKLLRDVMIGETGYRLMLWDTYRSSFKHMGATYLGYALFAPNSDITYSDAPLFIGEDYQCGAMKCIDSDDSLRGILGFLTLRPGDTDSEWFDNYTAEQMAFAKGDAEELSLWAMDDNDVGECFKFIDRV